MALINFNPFLTSQPQNTFLSPTQGYMQGTIYDDPVARLQLMGGYIDSGETVVMWGGLPICEMVNLTAAGASDGLGPDVKRATSQATTTGWSVFTQAGSMVLIPGGSYPPVADVGNYISFFRYGSLARIAVALDPAVITTLNSTNVQVGPVTNLAWDPTNYRVTVGTGGSLWALPTTTKLISTNATNSKIITYASSQASWATGAAAIIQI